MKTRHGDIDSAPSNGEDVQINAVSDAPPEHIEGASGGDDTMQAKDNVQASPDNTSRREHDKTEERRMHFEANDVKENIQNDNRAVDQESNLEREDGSGQINQPENYNLGTQVSNPQTGLIVTKEAGYEDLRNTTEGRQEPDLGTSTKEASDLPPPPDMNEDKNSLPEVDSHINEYQKSLNGSATVDEVDKSVNIESDNLELQEIASDPLISDATNKIDLKDIPLNSSTPKPVHKNITTKDTEGKEMHLVPKEETSPNNLNLEDVKTDVPLSKEAYDNPGFVGDEIPAKISDGTANVDATPVKAVCSDPGAGNVKLPRRVSFSELPPKAMYDNLGFGGDSKDGGENGKVQQDSASEDKGQEMDFLALYGPGEKWRILRNVLLMSAAFMVLFTSFFGAANLQSSVNAKAGLGTASLTTLYGGLVISNIFLPVTVIRWLRCKWTVAIMALGFAPYAMAQYHAEFYTLIPTALLAGLGAAPMWCAKCTYLNVAADAYAKVTGSAPELVMVRFFGIFYVLFPLGHVWGNLISSEVLSRGREEESRNTTIDVVALCGANYCPGLGATDNPNLQRPPDYQINTIASIFLACSLLSVLLVALGVDNLKRYNEGGRSDSGTGLSGMQLLVATARLLVNRNQIALIPITAFIGVSQAFLGADFTEGYISCAWGIPHIGYVLIGYGLASSIASVFVSWVVKTAGRLIVICSSITLFLILVTVMKFWQPSASQGVVFFTLAALWGLADSTALVINAMYGLLFRGNEAAAYSNFSLWGSAGFIVTYSYSPYLCMNTKLAILAVILILAMIGFITAEMALRKIIREQQEEEKAKKAVGEQQGGKKTPVS